MTSAQTNTVLVAEEPDTSSQMVVAFSAGKMTATVPAKLEVIWVKEEKLPQEVNPAQIEQAFSDIKQVIVTAPEPEARSSIEKLQDDHQENAIEMMSLETSRYERKSGERDRRKVRMRRRYRQFMRIRPAFTWRAPSEKKSSARKSAPRKLAPR